jgi:uncharacterized membrane protein YbhN (UPF0104 family)
MTLSSRGAAVRRERALSVVSDPLPTEDASSGPFATGRSHAAAWAGGLLVSLLVAFAVLTGLGLYGDFRDVSATLAGFRWELLPALLGVTALNYVVRYLRWRKLLGLASGQAPGLWEDLLVFFGGTAMILTPARLGEWVKSYYARRLYGAPVARTAPIPVAERVSDSLAMLLLAGAGLVLFGWGAAVFVAVAGIAAVAVIVLRHRGLASLLFRGLGRVPPARRLLPSMEAFHESSRLLFSLPGLSWALGLGLIAWSLECLTFLLVLVGLGRPCTWELAVQAAFIFPIATLAGSLSLMPGGMGVTEGGITGMTQAIVGTSRSVAVASALLVRALILGFGFVLGVVALAVLTRRLSGAREQGRSVGQAPLLVTDRGRCP